MAFSIRWESSSEESRRSKCWRRRGEDAAWAVSWSNRVVSISIQIDNSDDSLACISPLPAGLGVLILPFILLN